jgi:hypothetical protein
MINDATIVSEFMSAAPPRDHPQCRWRGSWASLLPWTTRIVGGAVHAGLFPSRAVTLPRNSVAVTVAGSVIVS